MISHPSRLHVEIEPLPPAVWPLARALGTGQWDGLEKTLWVRGRIGASPAEEQGTPLYSTLGRRGHNAQAENAVPRPARKRGPFGVLLYNLGCLCLPSFQEAPRTLGRGLGKEGGGSAAAPRALGALWPACQDTPGAEAAVFSFVFIYLGVGWGRSCLASGAP